MSSNVKGGAIMLLAVGSFSFMDAGMKVLSSGYPPLQVAALRCLSSLPLILLWVGFRGGFRQVLRVRFGLHALRAAIGIVMLATFVYGLRRLPLSEAYAIFFVAPLLITVFAGLILGERIEWQRWAAVAIGLAGVLIVLRPTGAGVATLAGLSVVVCAVGYALSAILVRILGRTDSTERMVFWVLTLMGAGATLLALPRWRPIQPQHWMAIIVVGVCAASGSGPSPRPFASARRRSSRRSNIRRWSGAWHDWTFWRALPEARALTGAMVIIASGIYLIRRERSAPAAVAPDAICE